MGKFQSTKVFDGYSTVFRQWKARNYTVDLYMDTEFLLNYGLKEN